MGTPKILSQYAEAITARGHKLEAANLHLLGLSVTSLTLLLPLSLLSLLTFANRIVLAAAVLFLLATVVLCLICQIKCVKTAEDKVKTLRDEAARQLAEELPPRVVWGKQKYAPLSALFSIASVCFAMALLSLSGVLFQILLS